ncbi:hypothetical protein C8R44DRAFT_687378 [Mycena epipterygia]|nr:hypothetical protein C8R44DRAFT_687378 [Mycena epipterygia]
MVAYLEKRIKGAQRFLWHSKDQPVANLRTLRDCLHHAATGGFRSATLAFNIRASFNLFLVLLKMRKVPRAQWLPLLRHATFGSDSFRFGAMLGTFAALYKFMINALPILIPAVQPSKVEEDSLPLPDSGLVALGLHPRRLSLGAHTQSDLLRKRTRRWHSALSGAISGGLAILWEKRSRRAVIAQQAFVRGLQGIYNSYSERWGISIPYGAVIVFSLSCSQIMYAFYLRPDTLPRSYVNWIREANGAPAGALRFNMKAVQEHVVDMASLERLISTSDVTPTNLSSLLSLRDRALAGAPGFPRYIPCCGLHPQATSCWAAVFDKFFKVSRWSLPMYSAVHFVPNILFHWNTFCADPTRAVARASIGSVRSSAFLGAFAVLGQAVFCLKHGLYEHLIAAPAFSCLREVIPQRLIDVLISRPTWLLCGLSTWLALLIEDPRRRPELAMYVLPKALESLWVLARGQGLVLRTGNWGESVLVGLGMGMLMTVYQNEPQHMSGLVRKILYQFIGPN